MSNALVTDVLLEAIAAAVVSAWGPIVVDFDDPPRLPLAAPYSVVSWLPVDVSFTGPGSSVRSPGQTNTFSILGRFPFPSDPTQKLALLKVTKANALIALLQAGPTFTAYGFLPLVTNINPGEGDDPNERVYEVTLTFVVQTVADHH